MSLYHLAQQRAATGRPVRIGLIGAGKFGSMFLNQIPGMPGVELAATDDVDGASQTHRAHVPAVEHARLERRHVRHAHRQPQHVQRPPRVPGEPAPARLVAREPGAIREQDAGSCPRKVDRRR